ncbi:MAG: 16S rRNA (guanine(527)-N(7))-methyltransferase RsmG [Candidatus Sumerlaeia bacterium]|nr:16S rRNA (guanine(527)-N(7))-methyltransferase RsmG [Candidatus Sumerlaeia bacterium]
MPDDSINILTTSLAELNIYYTAEQITRIKTYIDILLLWNRRMNLISDTSLRNIIRKHIIDSLAIAVQSPPEFTLQNKNLLDAGSGAGLPGIVLHIFFPSARTVLVESRQKKCQFLQEVITKLQLQQISVIQKRLENLAHEPEFREQFEVVVARALGKLAVAAELCLPFVTAGGFFVAYKSRNYQPELTSARTVVNSLGAELCAIREFTLPGTEIARALLYFRKIAHTPDKYPRRAGIPQKRPLHWT